MDSFKKTIGKCYKNFIYHPVSLSTSSAKRKPLKIFLNIIKNKLFQKKILFYISNADYLCNSFVLLKFYYKCSFINVKIHFIYIKYIMKYLFIDIRKSDEAYTKHFDQSKEYSFYNIPMNMIRFNSQTIINHLEYVDEIYIVCQSAKRSQFIKDKYFNDYERIKVNQNLQFSKLNHGSNNVFLDGNTGMRINIVGSNSFNFYSVMRIIQTIMGIIMLSVGIYIYIQLRKEKLLKKINILSLLILVLFGSMSLYNGLTSTCSISILLENYLN